MPYQMEVAQLELESVMLSLMEVLPSELVLELLLQVVQAVL